MELFTRAITRRAKKGKEDWGVPDDIAKMCETIELTPRITGPHHRSADDEMTIQCAYRRNCRFLGKTFRRCLG